jgi:membrane protease YdiL (CAAX protease family)
MIEGNTRSRAGRFRKITRVSLIRLILFFFVLGASYTGAQLLLLHTENKYLPAAALGIGVTLLAIYVLLVRLIERRWARELSPVRGLPLAIGGALFGLALFCAIYAVLWALGIAQWQGITGFGDFLTLSLFSTVLAPIGEELVMRGGVFRILEDSFGTAVALILSAALFGFLHAYNPGATIFSSVAIALEAGILLGAAYAVSRNLWLPIGLHFGWNFSEGNVFGAAVSGNGGGEGIVNMPLSGPQLLTGGAFGPEASVVAMVVSLLAAFVFIALTIRKGRWVPLSFHLMLD